MPNVALIILAAGNSSRLSEPKQLKSYRGKTLVEHMIAAGNAAGCSPVIAVLGSHIELIKPLAENVGAECVGNSQWSNGMGSSIVAGIKHLQQIHSSTNAAIIATCDQPFLDAAHLSSLMAQFNTSANVSIVASSYANTIGVPALFSADLFTDLANLPASEGARKIINRNKDKVETVDFPEGNIDIDTEEDWLAFLRRLDSVQ